MAELFPASAPPEIRGLRAKAEILLSRLRPDLRPAGGLCSGHRSSLTAEIEPLGTGDSRKTIIPLYGLLIRFFGGLPMTGLLPLRPLQQIALDRLA